jgi:hypothetical protein
VGFAYELRVRGRLSPTVLSQFEYLDSYEVAEAPGPSGNGSVVHATVLRGTVPDQAALHGVLRQVGALGLDLVELRRPQPG